MVPNEWIGNMRQKQDNVYELETWLTYMYGWRTSASHYVRHNFATVETAWREWRRSNSDIYILFKFIPPSSKCFFVCFGFQSMQSCYFSCTDYGGPGRRQNDAGRLLKWRDNKAATKLRHDFSVVALMTFFIVFIDSVWDRHDFLRATAHFSFSRCKRNSTNVW